LYGASALSAPVNTTDRRDATVPTGGREYDAVFAELVQLFESARSAASRSVNAVMTTTDWAIGQRIVEHEQGGRRRAEYGAALME